VAERVVPKLRHLHHLKNFTFVPTTPSREIVPHVLRTLKKTKAPLLILKIRDNDNNLDLLLDVLRSFPDLEGLAYHSDVVDNERLMKEFILKRALIKKISMAGPLSKPLKWSAVVHPNPNHFEIVDDRFKMQHEFRAVYALLVGALCTKTAIVYHFMRRDGDSACFVLVVRWLVGWETLSS
jgi:hypothetical protein